MQATLHCRASIYMVTFMAIRYSQAITVIVRETFVVSLSKVCTTYPYTDNEGHKEEIRPELLLREFRKVNQKIMRNLRMGLDLQLCCKVEHLDLAIGRIPTYFLFMTTWRIRGTKL